MKRIENIIDFNDDEIEKIEFGIEIFKELSKENIKAIFTQDEIDEINKVKDIINNNINPENDLIYEYGEWGSADTKNFGTVKQIGSHSHIFEIALCKVLYIGCVEYMM
jgi:hypothetical protein